MSISSALNTALTGLAATTRLAEVTASNLSNALTEGYGPRSVELASKQLGGAGAGVRVVDINRFVDAGLLADRRLTDAALGGEQMTANALVRLEQVLGAPGDPAGLSARLAEVEFAFISASSDPASETRLAGIVSRMQDLTNTLQDNTRSIQDLRQEADGKIARDVDVLNAAILQVEKMNKDIRRMRAVGAEISSVVDARQTVIDQIAEIVPVREIKREFDTVALMTTSGMILLDGRAAQFEYTNTPTITAQMSLAAGSLSGILLDGVPIDTINGIGKLDGGSMGAAFAMRDKTLPEVQAGLDGIAADLIARFEDTANDATIAPGSEGLLTDSGAPLDPLNIEGLAARITVNSLIDPAQGGTLSLLRDGLYAAAPGPTGNGAQLDQWVVGLADQRSDLAGAEVRSAAGRIADFGAQVGMSRVNAQERLSYTSARWDTLHEAELANGVDTDLELQNLLRVEKAYAANAKVIQTVDFMLQSLLEI